MAKRAPQKPVQAEVVAPAAHGRPSSYTRELSDEILRRMRLGETLTAICKTEGMPARSTVAAWVDADVDGFRDRYAPAREAQADAIAEKAYHDGIDPAGDPQSRRLAFDAGRWFAGKMRPRVWGEKQTHEHTGADGGPIKTEAVVLDPAKLEPEQLDTLAAALRASGAKLADEGE